MSASRLARDRFGRLVVVLSESTVELDAGVVVGHVLGNGLQAGGLGVYWLGRTGRAPTSREQTRTRAPFNSNGYPPSRFQEFHRSDADDELELADREAIEATRREQELRPPDLIGRPLPG